MAAEPWCFTPDVIDRMTREIVFEEYLKPDDKKQDKSRQSHRELQFLHWQLRGDFATWEECEREWQRLNRS